MMPSHVHPQFLHLLQCQAFIQGTLFGTDGRLHQMEPSAARCHVLLRMCKLIQFMRASLFHTQQRRGLQIQFVGLNTIVGYNGISDTVLCYEFGHLLRTLPPRVEHVITRPADSDVS